MKHILAIPSRYPTERAPSQGVFVQALMDRFRRLGTRVSIVAPQKRFSGPCHPAHDDDLRPPFLSYSSRRIGPLSTLRLTNRSFLRAARNAISSSHGEVEAVYSHFLIPGGLTAVALGEELHRPAFVALGEGNFNPYESHYTPEELHRLFGNLAGILCLSEENQRRCIEDYGVAKARTLMLPNAADSERFFPLDRARCRQELGLPSDAFLVAFAGHFNENKGVDRVIEACRKVPGCRALLLGGNRPLEPHDVVLCAKRVPQEKLPLYLNAADCFMLPTIQDCSPNVIGEALACGLPILGSDIASIRFLCGDQTALLYDPQDIEGFAKGITALKEDPERRSRMSQAAL
ncbi:MAG: glycosyltransferase family 4 protein, partial [Planctomycetota bacterium]